MHTYIERGGTRREGGNDERGVGSRIKEESIRAYLAIRAGHDDGVQLVLRFEVILTAQPQGHERVPRVA